MAKYSYAYLKYKQKKKVGICQTHELLEQIFWKEGKHIVLTRRNVIILQQVRTKNHSKYLYKQSNNFSQASHFNFCFTTICCNVPFIFISALTQYCHISLITLILLATIKKIYCPFGRDICLCTRNFLVRVFIVKLIIIQST